MAISWRVHELTDERGWTARQLAKAAGIDAKTARNIVAGHATRVDLETIDRVATALGVPPGALWSNSGEADNPWKAAAGAAGEGTPEETARVLAESGDFGDDMNPALDRATRQL